jgi:hypothetical protein
MAVLALVAGLVVVAPVLASPYDFDGDGRQTLVAGLPAWPAGQPPGSGGAIAVIAACANAPALSSSERRKPVAPSAATIAIQEADPLATRLSPPLQPATQPA